MNPESGKPRQVAQLGDDALARIAGSLSDLYGELYDARPGDAHASLTANMLAFVFEGGLTVADEWLLRMGKEERLREFRGQFFEVISERMVAVVADLTGKEVTYSFFGFDPRTRTTHAIFVLDLSELNETEQRQAVLNWSEQVRRNARRLREEHVATREIHHELAAEVRRYREQSARQGEDPSVPGSDDR
jgi:uncharacterized protein YbcI